MQKIWLSRLHTRSQTLFNEIIICVIFISVNAFWNFLSHETYSSHLWLWPAYVKSRFAFIRTVEINSLCLQLKRSGTEYAAQKIIFLILAVANGRTLLLWKVWLGSDEVFKSYYLFIFSSHQHVQHMTSQILLILIDFDSLFRSVFDLKLLIFKPL